ncbi:MAG TPA: hypothetical protein PKD64_05065 [Pirellulaceae bacterium]|nr:hypothetical protein [Pirellulaceae bacterium]HMO91546.1 hypothetical protein [Pirellulaceae bacterium]HMP68243.1 hypothetical protein [Pirellulaceae bacterium]
MKKADLIGWDWRIDGTALVVFPTAKAYAKYSVYFLAGPLLVLTCLTVAGVTPWGMWSQLTSAEDRKPFLNEAEIEQMERAQRQIVEDFRREFGDEATEKILQKVREKADERATKNREQDLRITWVGIAISFLVGMIWLLMTCIGLCFIAALLRLPTATYRFARNANGELIVRIPHLFYTREYRVPANIRLNCGVGNYIKRVGKYGMRVLIWYVCFIPIGTKPIDLPIFVVADQMFKEVTGNPPRTVIDFHAKLHQVLLQQSVRAKS